MSLSYISKGVFTPESSLKAGGDIDWLIAEKTRILLLYDSLQKEIKSCGFGFQMKEFLDLISENSLDEYSAYRLKLEILKCRHSLRPIDKKISCKMMEKHSKSIYSIVKIIMYDYHQLGILFLNKLGNSTFTDMLKERVYIHQQATLDLINILKSYKDHYLRCRNK